MRVRFGLKFPRGGWGYGGLDCKGEVPACFCGAQGLLFYEEVGGRRRGFWQVQIVPKRTVDGEDYMHTDLKGWVKFDDGG